MHLVIVEHASIPPEHLERCASRVIPPMLKREFGKSLSRKNSFFAGRAALAWGFNQLKQKLYVAPNQNYGFLEVYDAMGHKKGGLFVNISHTDEIAVAVISNSPVGVDIESKTRSAARVLPRVATERERKWVEAKPLLPNGVPTGIFVWSAKEAFGKALGLGIKFGMRELEILDCDGSPFEARSSLQGPLKVENPRIDLSEFGPYLITVCAEEKTLLAGIQRRILTLSDLKALG